ncbi:hypothetical protein AB1L07_14165 [Niallia alba]|nr:amidohydrolase 2 [Niallia nealsonii AAU1]
MKLVGWHSGIYVDSQNLAEIAKIIERLQAVSIDHLGLSEKGFSDL